MVWLFLLFSAALGINPAAYTSCSCDGCSQLRGGYNLLMGIPSAPVSLRWSLPPTNESLRAKESFLGCSSNGDIIACSLPQPIGLIVVSGNGTLLWNSTILDGDDPRFTGGAPVVSDQGFVGAMNGHRLAYYDSNGKKFWDEVVSTNGFGAKFSPGATTNGYLPLTLGSGSMAIYEISTGLCWASMRLGEVLPEQRFYNPTGTIGALGPRTYVPTKLEVVHHDLPLNHSGRLYAVDSSPDEGDRLKVRWWYEFDGAIEGQGTVIAENLTALTRPVILFFGLGKENRTTLYALEDDWPDTNGTLLWSQPWNTSSLEIMIDPRNDGADPRGSCWVYDETNKLYVRLALSTGNTLQKIDLSLFGKPTSRGIIAPGLGQSIDELPLLVFAVDQCDATMTSCLLCFDLNKASLLWSWSFPPSVTLSGQIVLVDPEQRFEGGLLVFAGSNRQLFALG